MQPAAKQAINSGGLIMGLRGRAILGLTATAFYFLFVDLAWAAGNVGNLTYPDPTPVAAPSIGGALLRLLICLIIVIGLVIVLVKFLQRNPMLNKQNSWARVIDQIVIAPNKTLVLTEIFGKIYILGITDHNITQLLEEKDIDLSLVKQIVEEAEARQTAVPKFINKTFVDVLEPKIAEFRKRYNKQGKGRDL